MDPFFASPTAHMRTPDAGDPETIDFQQRESNKQRVSSQSTLRRSTGLFNLKLKSTEPLESYNPVALSATTDTIRKVADPNTLFNTPSIQAQNDIANMTPDLSNFQTSVSLDPPPINASGGTVNPLKRPNPFNSSKSSILGITSHNILHSKKRLHTKSTPRREARDTEPKLSLSNGAIPEISMPFRDLDSFNLYGTNPQVDSMHIMTPELSFKGAKPIQTAFAPSGLQSKRSISDSPKLRVPETPCKRHVSDQSASIDPHILPSWPPSAQPLPRSHNLDLRNPTDASPKSRHSYNLSINNNSNINIINSSSSSSASSSNSNRSTNHTNSSINGNSNGNANGNANGSTNGNAGNILSNLGNNNSNSSFNISDATQSAPVDRLQRFSLSKIGITDAVKDICRDDGDASTTQPIEPDTPTKYPYTSTPLRKTQETASRFNSEASTATPGTIVRPLPSVLRHLDDSESLSLSPPSRGSPIIRTEEDYEDPRVMYNPRTPEVEDVNNVRFNSRGSRYSSPVARRFRQSGQVVQRPALPELNLRTPSGKSDHTLNSTSSTPEHNINSPHTPGRMTPVHQFDISSHYDELLVTKFGKVQSAAVGEFSVVFIVTQGKSKFAVKRTKRAICSRIEAQRRREEIDILRSLSLSMELTTPDSADERVSTVPHIVQFVDEWVSNGFGYIRTEFCENGDLSRFLAAQGRVSRLEEWRVWKILLESLMGLSVIHNAGILHLDLKPANILVTFEGHLKIGDFGMATRYPVPNGFEREGDREYIAPEVLQRHEYGPPADIFSLGLMMVEVAANIVLPDNGEHWHRLRSGDLRDAGRLSSGDLTLAECLGSPSCNKLAPPNWAPPFLVNGSRALDRVVQHMLRPDPSLRPSVDELLAEMELCFVTNRRQAGAVVFEGEFGPKPDSELELNAWQRA